MSGLLQRHVNEASRCLKGASIAHGGGGGFNVVKDRVINSLKDERYYALTDAAKIINSKITSLHQQFDCMDISREVEVLQEVYDEIMKEATSE